MALNVKRKRKRQMGAARPFWGFRPTAGVEKYVDSLAKTAERSSVLLDLLEEAIEARKELGDDYFELAKRAGIAKEPLGKVMGRLVKVGLKR